MQRRGRRFDPGLGSRNPTCCGAAGLHAGLGGSPRAAGADAQALRSPQASAEPRHDWGSVLCRSCLIQGRPRGPQLSPAMTGGSVLCSERSCLIQGRPHGPVLSPTTTGGSMLCSERSCLMQGRPRGPPLRPDTPKYISNFERKKKKDIQEECRGTLEACPSQPDSSSWSLRPGYGSSGEHPLLQEAPWWLRRNRAPWSLQESEARVCISSLQDESETAHPCYGLRPLKYPISAHFRGEKVVTSFCYIK